MRTFAIASIASILGIIVGLYFYHIAFLSCVFLTFLILAIILPKYRMHLFLCFLFFTIFYFYISNLEKNHLQKLENYGEQEVKIKAIIVSNPQDKDYKLVYEIKVIEMENLQTKAKITKPFQLLCNIKKEKEHPIQLEYGELISFTATYEVPTTGRNEGGFDYDLYLRTKKIEGSVTIQSQDIQKIAKNQINSIFTNIFALKNKIISEIQNIFSPDVASVCIGLLLGDQSYITEDIQESFRQSSLSHMLAISGSHIAYILPTVTTFLGIFRIHRKWKKILLILFILFFMALVGNAPSIMRACIMSIFLLLSEILHRKLDTYQNLGISTVIILVCNPYSLFDIGFQLSYGGTIGIILFAKRLMVSPKAKNEVLEIQKIKKQPKVRQLKNILQKMLHYIKEMAIVSIAANIIIIPIMIYHFNTLSTIFLISNLLASPISGIALVLGMIFLILLLVKPFAVFLSFFLSPILQLFISIAQMTSQLPFSQVWLVTPKIWQILLYYVILFLFFFRQFYSNFSTNTSIETQDSSLISEKKLLPITNEIIAMEKSEDSKKHIKISYFFNQYRKIIMIICILLIVFPYFVQKIPTDHLTIHMIDVGQGDSILIQTPSRKTILIDGGGSEMGNFDVGEKTLLPYLLDKSITKIDYMFFTHMDSDHCEGLFTILEQMRVENVIISKQGKNSDNFQEFLKIVQSKKVNLMIVKQGDKVIVDKQCYFDILFPEEQLITENILNNNSIVSQFYWKDKNQNTLFSMLLTGDIEEITEKQLIQKYQNTNQLQSTVLKVAHHGSKSSSIEPFLELVKPKIALIGVGTNNTFGHPNQGVLQRLENGNTKIFRTDLCGEIILTVNQDKSIRTKTQIEK